MNMFSEHILVLLVVRLMITILYNYANVFLGQGGPYMNVGF